MFSNVSLLMSIIVLSLSSVKFDLLLDLCSRELWIRSTFSVNREGEDLTINLLESLMPDCFALWSGVYVQFTSVFILDVCLVFVVIHTVNRESECACMC